MIALLDVNVLVALGDPDHVHAEAAMRFFGEDALAFGWATCPLTENGFLRIFGHAKYPGGPGSTEAARRVLLSMTANPGHQFWAEDLTLTDRKRFSALPESKALTDSYLLALAVKHGCRLATFDRRINPAVVPGGTDACWVIPSD